MMSSLLKDLGDIGAVVGGNAAENKVNHQLALKDMKIIFCPT